MGNSRCRDCNGNERCPVGHRRWKRQGAEAVAAQEACRAGMPELERNMMLVRAAGMRGKGHAGTGRTVQIVAVGCCQQNARSEITDKDNGCRDPERACQDGASHVHALNKNMRRQVSPFPVNRSGKGVKSSRF